MQELGLHIYCISSIPPIDSVILNQASEGQFHVDSLDLISHKLLKADIPLIKSAATCQVHPIVLFTLACLQIDSMFNSILTIKQNLFLKSIL